MKAAICWIVCAGVVVAASQPALAGHDARRYQIVRTLSAPERGSAGTIVVLDRRTGDLWTWSENEGTAYAGMLATNQPGSFARIIAVDR
jgi:hypothetical protein